MRQDRSKNKGKESEYQRITDNETKGEAIVVIANNTAATENTQEDGKHRKKIIFSEIKNFFLQCIFLRKLLMI